MLATTNPLSATSPVMPLITASCSGPGGSSSRFQAMSVDGLLMRLPPLQRALAPLIDEADRQHGKEDDHREEAEHADVAERDRPRKQKGDFQVEDDEQDRDEVEPH